METLIAEANCTIQRIKAEYDFLRALAEQLGNAIAEKHSKYITNYTYTCGNYWFDCVHDSDANTICASDPQDLWYYDENDNMIVFPDEAIDDLHALARILTICEE